MAPRRQAVAPTPARPRPQPVVAQVAAARPKQSASSSTAGSAPAPQAPQAPQVKVKELEVGRYVTNILGSGDSKPTGTKSWIGHWARHSGRQPMVCCALGCARSDALQGGHVKLASSPALAALKARWYIVPVCRAHNKPSSCKSFQVKAYTVAVEAPPSTLERLGSWSADFRKLGRALVGKRR